MLKDAHTNGHNAALATFGLDKHAAPVRAKGLNVIPSQAAPVKPTGVKGFAAGQKQHLSNLGKGVGHWADTSQGPLTRGMGKSMTLQSAKGLLPAAGIGLGALWGAKKLFGKKDREQ